MKKKIFFMTMTCCVIMLGYQSITAMANTNHCNESVNLNGIAGELAQL